MKTYILSFILIFLAPILSHGVVAAETGNSSIGYEENCVALATIVWALGAGTEDANIVYKLHDDGNYYSDNGCQGSAGDGYKILKSDGQWQLINPNDNILYISDFDSETPPIKGWKVSGGVSPAPTFGGGVTNNEIPEITNIALSGSTNIGETLTATYSYSHPSETAESGSIYKWFVASDTTSTKTLISGATSRTYTLTSSEDEKYIQFEVTPNDGSSVGTTKLSSWIKIEESVEVTFSLESITRFQPTDSITNVDYIAFVASFDAPVKNADASDFTLNGTTGSLKVIPVLDSDYESYRLSGFSENESDLLAIENDITAYQNLTVSKRDDFKSYVAASEAQIDAINSDLDFLRATLTEFENQLLSILKTDGDDKAAQIAEIDRQLGVIEGLRVDAEQVLIDNPEKEAEALNMLGILNGLKTNLLAQKEALNEPSEEALFQENKIALKEAEIDSVEAKLFQKEYFVIVEGGDLTDLNDSITILLNSSNNIVDTTGGVISGILPTGVNENRIRIDNSNPILELTSSADNDELTEPEMQAGITLSGSVNELTLLDKVYYIHKNDTGSVEVNDGVWSLMLDETTLNSIEESGSVSITFKAFDLVGNSSEELTRTMTLNRAPVVSNITFSGVPEVDSVLTVTYDYSDKEGENEQGSEYRWYTSNDTTGVKTIIQGETSTSYTFKSDDEGNYIQFVITPNDGTVIGDSLASKWIGPVTLPKPEMVVKGSGVEIVHNAAISSISDSTNFGVVAVTDSIVSSVYRVFNIGDAPLLFGNSAVTITGVNNSDFEITAQPNSIVPAGDSTKFIVAFNPLDSGNREAQINISSNNADENPYNFTISGTGNAAPSIAGTLANQVVNENEIITPFSTVVFEDNEADDISITVKLDDNFKGSLNSLEFTGVGPYSLVATSISNAQEAIREITFNPTDNRVLTGDTETTRFIITISDDLSTVTDTLTTVISTAINEAPITSVTEPPVIFVEGSKAVKIDASISISDNDNNTFQTAKISISNGFEVDEDSLGFINDNSTMGNIVSSFDLSTGVLTLTSDGATATNEEFERALRSIFYMNLSAAPKTHDRSINFSVNDGLASSNEGSKILKITSVNNVPLASNAQVNGSEFVGDDLEAEYAFTDADNDIESGSIYKWYVADDTVGTKSLLDGANDTVYTLEKADEGKYLQFVVFPSDGTLVGDSVKSSWIGPVIESFSDILVQGNGINIKHGSVTASENDSTNFGSISITDTSVIRNYTIQSTGTDTLTFSRNAISIIGESADEFVVIDEPSGWIQDGDSTTFSIKFDPSVSGVRKATIRIANNVAGKNPYTFVIEGIGLNTAPVFTSLDTVDIKENTQIATTLTANDEETPESLIYSLVVENRDGSLFNINNESGELTFKSIPNFETPLDADEDNIYEITVSVSDGDKEALQQLKIVVSDENEFAPVFTSSSKASVYESTPSGTIVATITATDEDATSNLKYSLVTNPQDIFELEELSGKLKIKQSAKLDKKVNPLLIVELLVTDGDSSASQELEVEVLTIPIVVAISPKSDVIGVKLDTEIKVIFDQQLQAGKLSDIKLANSDGEAVKNVSASITDSILKIKHDTFTNNTKYTVSLAADAVLNSDNVGNELFEWSFRTELEAPEKVALLGPISSEGTVELNTGFKWEEADRASSYNFQLSDDSLFTENVVSESTISVTTLELSTDLEFYQYYYWRVQGENEDGKGEWSQVAHFVTIAEVPTQIFPLTTATNISTAPTIQWSSGYEESTFQVQLVTTNSSDSFSVDTTVTQSEFLITGLKANTEYSWKVRILDAATSSTWSDETIFTTRPDPEEENEEPINVNITFGGASGGSTNPDGETVTKSDKIEVTDYRMVGLPGTDNIRLDTFFKGKYKKDWRAFIETGSSTEFYNEYAPEDNRFVFKPGLGFWVLSTKIVADTYDFTPVKINENDAYGVSVQSGWNIIANPYRSDVEWKLVQEMNNITEKIYDYKQQFIETDTLKVLGGYYFYNDPQLDIDTLFIPYTGFDQRGLKKDTTDRSKGIPNLLIEAKDNKNHSAEVKVYYPEIKGKVVDKKFLTSYHPNIEQARFGMVLKDDELRKKLKTTSSYFDNEGQKYELELKGERGTNLNWNVEFDRLPENGAALLVNKITQEVYLLDKSMSFSTLISESHSKFDLYVGDLDVLKEKKESLIPQEFELQPNYPNPFNPTTTINFSLPKEAKVSLIVYDILGRKVATLVNGKQKAGWHKIYFDGSNLASGVYLYRLIVDKQQKLGKMTLIK